MDIGVDTLVLSGYPHLEEAIRCDELMFPLIGKAAVTTGGSQTGGSQTGGVLDIRATTFLQKSAS